MTTERAVVGNQAKGIVSERVRLDIALEQRGLVQSRARGRDAVLRGTVSVNGAIVAKPGQLVADDDNITIDDPASGYVARSALKLIAGLEAGGIDVAGKTCLDLGASTGGFSQVLAERGAAKIYAVDVGHGQLHADVRALPVVVAMEEVNARDLSRDTVPESIDLLVCDISFVSVMKVLAAPLGLCRGGADAVILIKPQFEVGREHIGKGGLVSDMAAADSAVAAVILFMGEHRFVHRVSVPSPIAGGDGNKETVAVFRRA